MSNSFNQNIILNDLKNLGIDKYSISEHVIVNPTTIEVSNRELIYVHYFCSTTPLSNTEGIMIKSSIQTYFYNYTNTKPHTNYSESEAFHKYNSDAHILKHGSFKFFIHYYKITF
jgi:hypothetical protein